MTSEAISPDDLTPDQIVGWNVHDLLWQQNRKQKGLALSLGLTPSVLSKKLRGMSGWSVTQMYEAAEFLGVDPGRLMRKPTVASVWPFLEIVEGGGLGGPRTSDLQLMQGEG